MPSYCASLEHSTEQQARHVTEISTRARTRSRAHNVQTLNAQPTRIGSKDAPHHATTFGCICRVFQGITGLGRAVARKPLERSEDSPHGCGFRIHDPGIGEVLQACHSFAPRWRACSAPTPMSPDSASMGARRVTERSSRKFPYFAASSVLCGLQLVVALPVRGSSLAPITDQRAARLPHWNFENTGLILLLCCFNVSVSSASQRRPHRLRERLLLCAIHHFP